MYIYTYNCTCMTVGPRGTWQWQRSSRCDVHNHQQALVRNNGFHTCAGARTRRRMNNRKAYSTEAHLQIYIYICIYNTYIYI